MAEPKTFYSKKEIAEMVAGTHASQTKKLFSTSLQPKNPDANIIRNVGDKWEDLDSEGNVKCIWEQKQGYRVRSTPNSAITQEYQNWKNTYPNCYDNCANTIKGRLDEKYRSIYGMCSECAAKYETQLKTSGSWQAYERSRMMENAKAFFQEADAAAIEAAERIKKLDFTNETGRTENWVGSDERAEGLLKEYNEYKTHVLQSLEESNELDI